MTVTLSDDGGQPVEEYNVSHTGRDSYIILLTPLTVFECTCLWVYSLLSICQVTINGTAMTFSGSADLQFIGTVAGLSLVHGVIYTVTVVARNSVGASDTFNGTVTATFIVQGMYVLTPAVYKFVDCAVCALFCVSGI